ncbi:hypothetical protein BGY98DRAFT_936902 [Russula aff. rugulosa BPL654]|nr:hypothetical protein BGY98DRAFT_936902 [Russula aff. rugulosa BPL654]
MSILSLAAPLATFVFFLGFAAAEISAPACSPSFVWTANSLEQNPCTVAAYLMATCSGGSFTLNALLPGDQYLGPTGPDDSDLCKCNTVTYSLLSACDACQGADWLSWSEFSASCTKTLPPSSFPNPIPSGTRVPQWALIDITSENTWNLDQATAVGGEKPLPYSSLHYQCLTPRDPRPVFLDTPEQAPGAMLGNGTPKSSSNTGAIAGGSVGGVSIISLVIAIGFFLRRRRRRAPAPITPPVVGAYQPPMDGSRQALTMHDGYTASSLTGTIGSSSMPGTPLVPMTNDSNYLSTFPGYQGVPQTPTTPLQEAVPSLTGNGSGNSLATLQTSRQQGYYHGLAAV